MNTFISFFLGVLVALTIVGLLADGRAAKGDPHVTPGLSLLPGDIKYESQDGRVKVYFPIVTSLMVSVVLSLVLYLFR